jgi:sulfate transport system substrate-binding protein
MDLLPKISLAFTLALAGAVQLGAAETVLLNASYDVTREFYKEYNPAFVAHWKPTAPGDTLSVQQSHGGSSKQVRSVIDGLPADVVTMNGVPDVDQLAKAGLIPADWAKRLPNGSVPYTSTILFVVRKGNPKGIKDWSDLVREGVSVVIPNPKISGNGRYSYLAAWIYALHQPGGSEDTAREFVKKLFGNVPVLDAGGRAATTTFAQRGIGDVLLTFENEAALLVNELGQDTVQTVVPSASILAENPVVWVDKVVKKKGTEKEAKAYLEYLFSPEAQELAAKHYFRPFDQNALAKYPGRFPSLPLYSVPDIFGSWEKAQKTHFADGGTFDQIYQK